MNMHYFTTNIAPKLIGYELTYSSYPNGDFGSLERVEFDGFGKIGTVDIWSKGWLDIDIYDLVLDKLAMNILLRPTEIQEQEEAFIKLLQILLKE